MRATNDAYNNIGEALRHIETALGYDDLDGPAAHAALKAADRLRVAQRQLRDELGFAAVIPFPTNREIA